jgi:uncharacterized protein YbjQ (UPF0145 family)
MSFFGFGGGGGNNRNQQPLDVTPTGVPNSAIARLRRMAGQGGQKPLWTSDLSVSEFVLLKQAGVEPLGLVMGSSIYHIGFQMANYYVNQELEYLSQAMYAARELAMSRMEEEAHVLGADGVVGVRIEVGGYDWAENLAEFVAVGTAVKAPEGEDHRTIHQRPFTSDLSAQDFYKLYSIGYVPAELVLGNCVYHVAHQGLGQQMMQMGVNCEMPNYTQALYEARELAMSRMQDEAERLGAVGIVGMNIIEKSHGWGTHVIEFLAIGTSIVPRKGFVHDVKLTSPAFQIGLDD